MPKLLIRIVALILIPCMLVDPTLAAGLSAPTPIRPTQNLSLFHTQALVPVDAFYPHSSFGRSACIFVLGLTAAAAWALHSHVQSQPTLNQVLRDTLNTTVAYSNVGVGGMIVAILQLLINTSNGFSNTSPSDPTPRTPDRELSVKAPLPILATAADLRILERYMAQEDRERLGAVLIKQIHGKHQEGILIDYLERLALLPPSIPSRLAIVDLDNVLAEILRPYAALLRTTQPPSMSRRTFMKGLAAAGALVAFPQAFLDVVTSIAGPGASLHQKDARIYLHTAQIAHILRDRAKKLETLPKLTYLAKSGSRVEQYTNYNDPNAWDYSPQDTDGMTQRDLDRIVAAWDKAVDTTFKIYDDPNTVVTWADFETYRMPESGKHLLPYEQQLTSVETHLQGISEKILRAPTEVQEKYQLVLQRAKGLRVELEKAKRHQAEERERKEETLRTIGIGIPTPLRPLTDKQDRVNVHGSTLEEALQNLLVKFPDLRQHLFTPEGKLRSFVHLWVNGEDITAPHMGKRREYEFKDWRFIVLKPADEVLIVPSMGFGAPDSTPASTHWPVVLQEASSGASIQVESNGKVSSYKVGGEEIFFTGAGDWDAGNPIGPWFGRMAEGKFVSSDGTPVDVSNSPYIQMVNGDAMHGMLMNLPHRATQSSPDSPHPSVQLELEDHRKMGGYFGPLKPSKSYQLENGALLLEQNVVNTEDTPRDASFGEHLVFNTPEIVDDEDQEWTITIPGTEYVDKLVPLDGSSKPVQDTRFDLRNPDGVPLKGQRFDFGLTNLPPGEITAVLKNKAGREIRVTWDTREYPHVWIWAENGHTAIEPISSLPNLQKVKPIHHGKPFHGRVKIEVTLESSNRVQRQHDSPSLQNTTGSAVQKISAARTLLSEPLGLDIVRSALVLEALLDYDQFDDDQRDEFLARFSLIHLLHSLHFITDPLAAARFRQALRMRTQSRYQGIAHVHQTIDQLLLENGDRPIDDTLQEAAHAWELSLADLTRIVRGALLFPLFPDDVPVYRVVRLGYRGRSRTHISYWSVGLEGLREIVHKYLQPGRNVVHTTLGELRDHGIFVTDNSATAKSSIKLVHNDPSRRLPAPALPDSQIAAVNHDVVGRVGAGYKLPTENRRKYWDSVKDPFDFTVTRRNPGLGDDNPRSLEELRQWGDSVIRGEKTPTDEEWATFLTELDRAIPFQDVTDDLRGRAGEHANGYLNAMMNGSSFTKRVLGLHERYECLQLRLAGIAPGAPHTHQEFLRAHNPAEALERAYTLHLGRKAGLDAVALVFANPGALIVWNVFEGQRPEYTEDRITRFRETAVPAGLKDILAAVQFYVENQFNPFSLQDTEAHFKHLPVLAAARYASHRLYLEFENSPLAAAISKIILAALIREITFRMLADGGIEATRYEDVIRSILIRLTPSEQTQKMIDVMRPLVSPRSGTILQPQGSERFLTMTPTGLDDDRYDRDRATLRSLIRDAAAETKDNPTQARDTTNGSSSERPRHAGMSASGDPRGVSSDLRRDTRRAVQGDPLNNFGRGLDKPRRTDQTGNERRSPVPESASAPAAPTKAELLEEFRTFKGTVHYPMALDDLGSLFGLRKRFPKARLVASDGFVPSESDRHPIMPDPANTEAVIRFLTEAYTSQAGVKSVQITPSEQPGILNVQIQMYPEWDGSDNALGKINFKYQIGLFEKLNVPAGVVYLRLPGYSGKFLWDREFWQLLARNLVGPRYVLTNEWNSEWHAGSSRFVDNVLTSLYNPMLDTQPIEMGPLDSKNMDRPVSIWRVEPAADALPQADTPIPFPETVGQLLDYFLDQPSNYSTTGNGLLERTTRPAAKTRFYSIFNSLIREGFIEPVPMSYPQRFTLARRIAERRDDTGFIEKERNRSDLLFISINSRGARPPYTTGRPLIKHRPEEQRNQGRALLKRLLEEKPRTTTELVELTRMDAKTLSNELRQAKELQDVRTNWIREPVTRAALTPVVKLALWLAVLIPTGMLLGLIAAWAWAHTGTAPTVAGVPLLDAPITSASAGLAGLFAMVTQLYFEKPSDSASSFNFEEPFDVLPDRSAESTTHDILIALAHSIEARRISHRALHVNSDSTVDATVIQLGALGLSHVIVNGVEAILARYQKPEAGYQGILRVRLESSGNELHVTISDNGVGISEPTLKRLFYDKGDEITTKKHLWGRQGGDGLGIYQMYFAFVLNTPGKIEFETRSGSESWRLRVSSGKNSFLSRLDPAQRPEEGTDVHLTTVSPASNIAALEGKGEDDSVLESLLEMAHRTYGLLHDVKNTLYRTEYLLGKWRDQADPAQHPQAVSEFHRNAAQLRERLVGLRHQHVHPSVLLKEFAATTSSLEDLDQEAIRLRSLFENDDQAIQVIDEAVKCITNARWIISSFQDEQKKTAISLNDLVQIVLDGYRKEGLLDQVEVTTHYSEPQPNVKTTLIAMERVLGNLILNAIKAIEQTPERHLTIETHWDIGDRPIILTLSDTGVGISPRDLSHLFARNSGLTIVSDIVSDMGGTIAVESEVGRGTTFTLRFPMTEPATKSFVRHDRRADDTKMSTHQTTTPPHWHPGWPTPKQPEIDESEAVLARLEAKERGDGRPMEEMLRVADTTKTPYRRQPGGLFIMALNPMSPIPPHRIVRALYYQHPDLAGALVMSFNRPFHEDWGQMIASLISEDELEMAVALMNRGLDLLPDRFPVWPGHSLEFDYNLRGFSGLFGYLKPEQAYSLFTLLQPSYHPILLQEFYDGIYRPGANPLAQNNLFRLLRKIPPNRIAELSDQLSPKLRQFFKDATAPIALIPSPRTAEALPRVPGRAIGPLVVIHHADPTPEALTHLTPYTIAAMEYLPTLARLGVSEHTIPLRGLLTFRQEGETSHAEERASLWGIPHALWPGPESLKELEGKTVLLEVTHDRVTLREATDEERTQSLEAAGLHQFPLIELPRAELNDTTEFLPTGDVQLRRPAVVGYKVALLNQLLSDPPPQTDPRIRVQIASGAGLPFGAFSNTLEDVGARTLYNDLIQEAVHAADPMRALQQLRNLLEHGLGSFRDRWPSLHMYLDRYRNNQQGIFARNSTNAENLHRYPGLGAGIYRTIPNAKQGITGGQLVRWVWSSLWTEEAFWDRERYGIDQTSVYPAVWFVPSQRADYSGVIKSRGTQQIIEIVQGVGETINDSENFAGFPTQVVWDRAQKQILNEKSRRSTKSQHLRLATDDEEGLTTHPSQLEQEFLDQPEARRIITALAEVGDHVERHLWDPLESTCRHASLSIL